jgi:hypothetical protein
VQLAHHRARRSDRLPGLAHVLPLSPPPGSTFPCVRAALLSRSYPGQRPSGTGSSVTRLRVIFALTLTRRPRTNLWGVSSASTESMAAGRSGPPLHVPDASPESSGSCCCLAAALRRTGSSCTD